MFKGRTPIAKAPTNAIVSPEENKSSSEWKKLNDNYKKSDHFKSKKKRK